MRVLHTSDWHLGRKLGEHSLLGEQQRFCDWLVTHVAEERIDLVAVSGDLFDRSIPPIEALELLGDTFRRLRDAGAVVAAITGNHDSASRLSVADGFTDAGGLYLRGGYGGAGSVTPIEVKGEGLQLLTVPYLDPHMAPAGIAEEIRGTGSAVTHESVLAHALGRARADVLAGVPSLVLAHAFVTNASPSASERDLAVGEAAMVSAELFDGFDYVALGHLHRPQALRSRPHMRYSGSPLPYSFSETTARCVVELELSEDGPTRIEQVEIPVGRRVCTVRGELEELVAGEGNPCDWVRAELTDDLRPVDAARELRRNHRYLAQVEWVGGTGAAGDIPTPATVRTREPRELMVDFWEHVRGEAPSPEVRRILEESLRANDGSSTEEAAA